MARTSEAPKINETSNGETREVHPAYGKITVTSPQGGKRKLFASNILHHSTISMVIETAELERKLGILGMESARNLLLSSESGEVE